MLRRQIIGSIIFAVRILRAALPYVSQIKKRQNLVHSKRRLWLVHVATKIPNFEKCEKINDWFINWKGYVWQIKFPKTPNSRAACFRQFLIFCIKDNTLYWLLSRIFFWVEVLQNYVQFFNTASLMWPKYIYTYTNNFISIAMTCF